MARLEHRSICDMFYELGGTIGHRLHAYGVRACELGSVKATLPI